MRLTDKEVSIADMYLDLDFDKDECENKLIEHESILDKRQRDKSQFERKSKVDASKYLLHETKSSFKMKSQFQISKKQFFAKIGKDRPNFPTTKPRTNSNPGPDKLSQSYSMPKSNTNPFTQASIRSSASVSSLGSESMLGERKFDFAKKNNRAYPLNNTELVVESYAFPNKPEYGELVVDKDNIDELLQNEPGSKTKTPDAKGIFRKLLRCKV